MHSSQQVLVADLCNALPSPAPDSATAACEGMHLRRIRLPSPNFDGCAPCTGGVRCLPTQPICACLKLCPSPTFESSLSRVAQQELLLLVLLSSLSARGIAPFHWLRSSVSDGQGSGVGSAGPPLWQLVQLQRQLTKCTTGCLTLSSALPPHGCSALRQHSLMGSLDSSHSEPNCTLCKGISTCPMHDACTQPPQTHHCFKWA